MRLCQTKHIITLFYLFLLLAVNAHAQTLQGVIEHLRVDTEQNSTSSLSVRIRTDENRIFELPSIFSENFKPRTIVEFSPSDFSSESLQTEALIDNITIIENPVEIPEQEHRVLIVKVNFEDGKVSCKNKKLKKILYKAKKNVRDWFTESSFENVNFNFDSNNDNSADIVSVTIEGSVTDDCDYDSWATLADSEAEEQGYDLTAYEHITYLIPEKTSCDWGGLGNLSCGTDCRVWIRQCKNKALYMHEYGHNLGLDHASLDEDNDGAVDQEYGDHSCPMGTATTTFRHFNGPHKATLNWIPEEQIVEYQEESLVQLAAVEIAPSTLTEVEIDAPLSDSGQVAKLPLPESTIGSFAYKHYYVSFRKKLGKYSKALPVKYKNGITIHQKEAFSTQTIEVATLTKPNSSYEAPNGSIITYLNRDGDNSVVWLSQNGISAPQFNLSAQVSTSNGAALSANELEKINLLIKKKFTSDKTTLQFDSAGQSTDEFTYGTYIVKIRYPNNKYSISKSKKKQSILISGDLILDFSLKRN